MSAEDATVEENAEKPKEQVPSHTQENPKPSGDSGNPRTEKSSEGKVKPKKDKKDKKNKKDKKVPWNPSPPPERYLVKVGGHFHSRGQVITLQPGKVITSQHYDIESVKNHGIVLEQITE